ncbi:MAG: DUF2975 domain-containing protein [Eubacterium sp.]|jgi:hypothetical protein|nr:DUF2975 domain-containing protein [Eubacterium sp.]
MKNKDHSLILSLILTKLLLTGLILTAAAMPWVARAYDNNRMAAYGAQSLYPQILITFYLAVTTGMAAIFALNKLLENIRKNAVFVRGNVHLIELISYFCFAEGIIFFWFGFFRPMSFVISGASIFFGLAVKVLKNVFSAAVNIKEESDFTI